MNRSVSIYRIRDTEVEGDSGNFRMLAIVVEFVS